MFVHTEKVLMTRCQPELVDSKKLLVVIRDFNIGGQDKFSDDDLESAKILEVHLVRNCLSSAET